MEHNLTLGLLALIQPSRATRSTAIRWVYRVGAALGRCYVAPIVLEDFRSGGALGGAPIDANAGVELGLGAARPLLGNGLVIESPGLRRGRRGDGFCPARTCRASRLSPQDSLRVGVAHACATGAVPELSRYDQNPHMQKEAGP